MNAARDSLSGIFFTFLRFGLMAWGGPVAQIAMIRDELVGKQQWVEPERFNRTLALYQALPGPEAHELCVWFGMVRAGRLGGLLAGLGFMLPGLVLMLALSWAYTIWGAGVLLPFFAGLAPAVAALVARATHRIGLHVLHSHALLVVGLCAILMTGLHVHFLIAFAICAVSHGLWAAGWKWVGAICLILGAALAILISQPLQIGNPTIDHLPSTLPLFLEGLKGGLFSFGGAYTILPLYQDSMVGAYPAITQQAFYDGIALSSSIPAPTVIFGTYLGFLADGFSGAMLMTLGIFLPAFGFTLIAHEGLEKLVNLKPLHGALDGIAAAVAGMLAITAFQMILGSVDSAFDMALFLAALAGFYLWKWRFSVPVIMVLCALAGYAFMTFSAS